MSFAQTSNEFHTSFVRFLTVDGTQAGLSNITANYSVVPQNFFIAPPQTETWLVTSVWVSMVAAQGFDPGGFAGDSLPLVNGLLADLQTESIQNPLTNITTNSDFQDLSNAVVNVDYSGSAYGFKAQIDYVKMGSQGVVLHGIAGDFFRVTARDDFSLPAKAINTLRFGITGGIIG